MIKKIIKNHPVISIIVSNMLVDTCCTGLFYYIFITLFLFGIGELINLNASGSFYISVVPTVIFAIFFKIFLLPYVYTIIEKEVKSGFAVDFIKSLKNNFLFLPILFICCTLIYITIPVNILYDKNNISLKALCYHLSGSIFLSYLILYIYWFYDYFKVNKCFPRKNKIYSDKDFYSYVFLVIVCCIYCLFVKIVIIK